MTSEFEAVAQYHIGRLEYLKKAHTEMTQNNHFDVHDRQWLMEEIDRSVQSWDTNCRSYVKHLEVRNKMEATIEARAKFFAVWPRLSEYSTKLFDKYVDRQTEYKTALEECTQKMNRILQTIHQTSPELLGVFSESSFQEEVPLLSQEPFYGEDSRQMPLEPELFLEENEQSTSVRPSPYTRRISPPSIPQNLPRESPMPALRRLSPSSATHSQERSETEEETEEEEDSDSS